MSLHKVCPNAAFFSLIPPLSETETPVKSTSSSNKTIFPRTLTSFFSEDNKLLTATELKERCDHLLSTYLCSQEQILNLFERTQAQNISSLWFEHRKGRVTGTKAHDILVRKDATPPDNLVMRIMDYKSYDLSKKEAIKWGLDNEAKVRSAYLQNNRKYHKNLKCELSGFQICSSQHFFGATADGVISCDCCGTGTLEIKCPHKHRNVSIQEAACTDKGFCLDSNLNLKQTHRYYTQVQFQMAVFDVRYADFVIMTTPNSEMCLVVVCVFRDDDFCSRLFDLCTAFHVKNVIPELLTRNLMDKPLNSSYCSSSELPRWCLCNEPEYGKMILCDNTSCNIGWYHYPCVNIKRKPRGRWICPDCKK